MSHIVAENNEGSNGSKRAFNPNLKSDLKKVERLLNTPFEEFFTNNNFRVCSVSTVLWVDPSKKSNPLVVGHQVPEISLAIEEKFWYEEPQEDGREYYYCVVAFLNWDLAQKEGVLQPVQDELGDRLTKAQNSKDPVKRQELEEALEFAKKFQKERNIMRMKELEKSE